MDGAEADPALWMRRSGTSSAAAGASRSQLASGWWALHGCGLVGRYRVAVAQLELGKVGGGGRRDMAEEILFGVSELLHPRPTGGDDGVQGTNVRCWRARVERSELEGGPDGQRARVERSRRVVVLGSVVDGVMEGHVQCSNMERRS